MSFASKRVTVITPALNSSEFITKALQSVKDQEYEDLEHVVVDGGSVDGTLEKIREYESVILIKQKSTGLYAALNEGLDAASGEFIFFLNSDDILERDAIGIGVQELSKETGCNIVKGRARFFTTDHTGNSKILRETQFSPCKGMDVRDLMFGVPVINARFFRRIVFERYGTFDTSYKIAADRELLIRFALSGCREITADKFFYNYRVHSKSLTLSPERGNAYVLGCEHRLIAHKIIVENENEMLHELCRQWISDAGVTAFAGSIRQFHLVQAMQIFVKQWRDDVLWPLIALKIVFVKLIKRVYS